jgi:UDP-glucose 4-epimerase
MAMYKLIAGAFSNDRFPLYGDGGQVRDLTYVGDVVAANIAAATGDLDPGTVINIAGGARVTLLKLVDLVGELTGKQLQLERLPSVAGDVRETGGTSERAQRLLGWAPQTTLRDGLQAALEWMRDVRLPASSTP